MKPDVEFINGQSHNISYCRAILARKLTEPLAWLTDVLERMVSGRTEATELERLLPWAWKAERLAAAFQA
jgi:hypothetical protein